MKKLILLLMGFSLISINAQAKKVYDRDWFEPVVGCTIGGAAGFLSNQDTTQETLGVSNEIFYGVVGCVAGGILGKAVQRRYKLKYDQTHLEEKRALQQTIRELQVQQAQRGESADLEANDYIIQKEIVPGKKLSNGDILSPTIKYRLRNPGQDLRVGD